MKITKVLMFLIIGILSLNLIYAGSIQKSFLIKGELTTPSVGGYEAAHPCNTGTQGDCKIFIYGPNSSSDNLAPPSFTGGGQNRRLTVDNIKNILSAGITTSVLNITSTAPTVDFTVKIMKDHSNNYPTEVLSTVVSVPNPNASGTQISANIFEGTDTEPICSSTVNAGQIRIINGIFKICKLESSEPGAPYRWKILISGGSSGLQFNDFNPLVFYKCPPAGCYVGSVLVPQLAGEMSLKNNAITNQYIAPGAISLSNLSQELKDYIDSKEMITNITNITELTELLDISNDSVTYDHLSSDLKQRIGTIATDIGAALDQPLQNKYYIIRDSSSGNNYYIPIYVAAGYTASANRNLVTLLSFDNTRERKVGTDYSGTYPPTSTSVKYSDYIYPQTNRKYITTERYRAIDVSISGAGANQSGTLKLKRCTGNDPSGEETNVPTSWSCGNTVKSDGKYETINDSLPSNGIINFSTDGAGNYSRKFHMKFSNGSNNWYAAAVEFSINGVNKTIQAAEIVHVYDPITEVTANLSNCKYTYEFEPGTPPIYRYTGHVSATTTAGGSSNSSADGQQNHYRWCFKIHNSASPDFYECDPTKKDNKVSGEDFEFYTNTNTSALDTVITIKDTRTGQRFAKYFNLSGCTPQN